MLLHKLEPLIISFEILITLCNSLVPLQHLPYFSHAFFVTTYTSTILLISNLIVKFCLIIPLLSTVARISFDTISPLSSTNLSISSQFPSAFCSFCCCCNLRYCSYSFSYSVFALRPIVLLDRALAPQGLGITPGIAEFSSNRQALL